MVIQAPYWMRLRDGGATVFTGQHGKIFMITENTANSGVREKRHAGHEGWCLD